MNLDRIVLQLRLLAGTVAIAGGAWWIGGPRSTETEPTPLVLPVPPDEPPGASGWVRTETVDSAVAGIVEGNVFSPTRQPPEVPYRPFESEDDAPAEDEMMAADTTGASFTADSGAMPVDEVVPRLYGTLLLPGNVSALLRLDSGLSAPQLYREGDRAGGYRVVRISEQAVVLAGPSGSITLRLTPSGKDLP